MAVGNTTDVAVWFALSKTNNESGTERHILEMHVVEAADSATAYTDAQTAADAWVDAEVAKADGQQKVAVPQTIVIGGGDQVTFTGDGIS